MRLSQIRVVQAIPQEQAVPTHHALPTRGRPATIDAVLGAVTGPIVKAFG